MVSSKSKTVFLNIPEIEQRLRSTGLKQKDLAVFLGVDTNTLQRWMNGEIKKVKLKIAKKSLNFSIAV